MSSDIDSVVVRPAGSTDLETLAPLVGSHLTDHGIVVPERRLESVVEDVLRNLSRGIFLVALYEARPIGFAYLAFVWSLEHAGPVAWLEELYVLPEHRERGVGEALLHAALDDARARGCAAVDLEVDKVHQRAEHLYYRNGFIRLTRTRWVKRLGGDPRRQEGVEP